MSEDELSQQLVERFASEPRVEVNTGPMSEGAPRNVDVDFVTDVEVDHVEYPELGEVYEVVLTLKLPRYNYAGPVHGNAVYSVLEEYGFERDGSPHHGVRFKANTVEVSGYKPVEDE